MEQKLWLFFTCSLKVYRVTLKPSLTHLVKVIILYSCSNICFHLISSAHIKHSSAFYKCKPARNFLITLLLTNSSGNVVFFLFFLFGVALGLCENKVLHRHVCIVLLPNPPIAILELPNCLSHWMANFAKVRQEYNKHVTMKVLISA